MKRTCITLFLIILMFGVSTLTVLASEIGDKVLHVSFFEKKIDVDGKLDDPIYEQLTPVSGFTQFHPKNGQAGTFKTEVYAFYNRKNIYFAFRCYDNDPGAISADVTPFGEYVNNDAVGIFLDTFADQRNFDSFSVNPRGIKSGKLTVWEADARTTSYGWSAEFKIPFKSLRFPVSPKQQWRVNFKRDIFRLNEELYWAPVGRDQTVMLGESFASLEGIENITGGKNIEVFPYAGFRDSKYGDVKDSKFAYGMDLKYGITSNLTLDLTTSPDYSEVESDPFFYQLEPFEYGLSENRPFYAEGSSYFDTIFDLFYTRRINNPTLAAKITGKEKGFSLGMLGARNEYNGDESFYGVFRLKKDILKLSTVGVIYSALEEGSNWNRNVGFDFNFNFKNIYHLTGMAAFSYNKDGSNRENGLYRLNFQRSVDKGLTFLGRYTRIEPGVYVPAGFVPTVDFQQFIGILKYSFRWEGKPIEKLFFTFWTTQVATISSGVKSQDTFQGVAGIVTRSRLSLTLEYFFGHFRPKVYNEDYQLIDDSVFYPTRAISIDLSYEGSRKLSLGGHLTAVDDFVYNDYFTGTMEGKSLFIIGWLNYKLSPQLQLKTNIERVYYNSFDHSIRFNGNLFSTSLNFQLNKQISSFIKFQYDSYLERFQYDFLLGYEPANVSKIYISIKNYSETRFRFFRPDARSITLKLSYLFRI